MTLSWGHKDIEAKGQQYHVGARFEALFMSVFMAASEFSCNFFFFQSNLCSMWEGDNIYSDGKNI